MAWTKKELAIIVNSTQGTPAQLAAARKLIERERVTRRGRLTQRDVYPQAGIR